MHIVRNNRIEEADDDEEFDYELTDATRQFGSHTNSIPLQSAVQAQRLFYGGRFANQALALEHGEAPLIQNLDTSDKQGRSFDEIVGEQLGAVRAKRGGKVVDVDKDRIRVTYDDGTKDDVDLYDNMNYNQKGGITSRALVQKGNTFTPGQMLAASSYTDDNGTQNMGLNARIGLVAWKGFSMDDAVPISESFAKRLSAIQYKVLKQDSDDNLRTGLSHYRSMFPTRYSKEKLGVFDDTGLVKPGTILEPGDPVLLATMPRTLSSVGANVGKLSKALKAARRDASITWDGHNSAEVVASRKTKNGYKVVLKYVKPTEEGDKIVMRQGAKCYHPDTEVFTERGWVRIPDLTPTDRVASLFDLRAGEWEEGVGRRRRPDQELVARFESPLAYTSHHFSGALYCLTADWAAYAVTGNHRVWRKGHTKACRRWYCMDAAEIHGAPQTFMVRANFDLAARVDPARFELPLAYNACSGELLEHATSFDFRVWVQFMAYYLAEGNVRHSTKKDHRIIITQKERAYCRDMEACFDAMGLKWTRQRDDTQYSIGPCKPLRLYLDQFGKAPDKFIPDEIKSASSTAIEIFLKAYRQGDGNKDKETEFYTTSARMNDDLMHLLVLSGRAATSHLRDGRPHHRRIAAGQLDPPTGLPLYTIRVMRHDTVSTRKNYGHAFSREPYDGAVYCLQVPGLGVLLTRYKGRAMWNGNSTVSKIIPDDRMPRTEDGQPLDIMINPLSLVSRANPASQHEIRLGKVAKALGQPLKIPSFLPKGQDWGSYIDKLEQEHGINSQERLFDPDANRLLTDPITVGYGFIQKLHHTSASKVSARGTGSYDGNEQPARGGGDFAQAKRFSGLENFATLSSGAYALMRENSTLRGSRNDDYWRALRSGKPLPKPGIPFVWDKFRALLSGSGIATRETERGRYRLAPMLDRDLDAEDPVDIENGDLVDISTLQPIAGGLFDHRIVTNERWGRIKLPRPVINPAMEESARVMLGLTRRELDDVLAGRAPLPDALQKRLGLAPESPVS